MHRFEQLARDDGGYVDRDPLRAIAIHPPAADQLLAFTGRFGGRGNWLKYRVPAYVSFLSMT